MIPRNAKTSRDLPSGKRLVTDTSLSSLPNPKPLGIFSLTLQLVSSHGFTRNWWLGQTIINGPMTKVGKVYVNTHALMCTPVLKWVSIYWFSRAGPAASVRIYYELSDQAVSPPPGPANVPFGVSLFPKEVTFARTM